MPPGFFSRRDTCRNRHPFRGRRRVLNRGHTRPAPLETEVFFQHRDARVDPLFPKRDSSKHVSKPADAVFDLIDLLNDTCVVTFAVLRAFFDDGEKLFDALFEPRDALTLASEKEAEDACLDDHADREADDGDNASFHRFIVPARFPVDKSFYLTFRSTICVTMEVLIPPISRIFSSKALLSFLETSGASRMEVFEIVSFS